MIAQFSPKIHSGHFGLAMDYHVVILSRVVENRRLGMSTRDAVERGIASTAGVFTSAAVIMVAVFSVFGTLSQVSMKQIGERNWYLPRWMQRLPVGQHVDAEPVGQVEVLQEV